MHELTEKNPVDPEKLLYSATHEWVSVEQTEGQQVATVGISAFAVEALTDLVFIELPEVGRRVEAQQPFCEVESVKAVSDIYSPVDGEVIAVNDSLADNLEALSADPYGAGWIARIRVENDAGLASLLDSAAYEKQCDQEAH